AGIPTWSPTVVLICRSTAYVWQSGRDAQFSADCGRMCLIWNIVAIYRHQLFTQQLERSRITSVNTIFFRTLGVEPYAYMKLSRTSHELPIIDVVNLLLA
ncbi:hypothetical protein KCU93_g7100, partial [Aureobasidium melanogenum]